MGKAVVAAKEIPFEHDPKAVTALNSMLSPIMSTHKLCLSLCKIIEAAQLSACLGDFAWSTSDAPRISNVLKSWLLYVAQMHLAEASKVVKG